MADSEAMFPAPNAAAGDGRRTRATRQISRIEWQFAMVAGSLWRVENAKLLFLFESFSATRCWTFLMQAPDSGVQLIDS